MFRRTTVLLLFAIALLVGVQSTALAKDSVAPPPRTLYVMGDSWSDYLTAGYGTIEAELAQRGYSHVSVLDYAIGGTTARGWAADNPCAGSSCFPGYFTELQNAIVADPTANPIVFLTLGGNDLLQRYQLGPGVGDAVFDEIEADMITIIEALTATRPDLKIIVGSYDILNFQQSIVCISFGLLVFGAFTPGPINALFAEGTARQQAVASQYPQVVAVNVAGALQGNPGNPDYSSWSPSVYVSFDCIHLTPGGYEIYMDAVFDRLVGPDVALALD